MKNKVCSIVLSAALMGSIATTTFNLITPAMAQSPKVHACIVCNLIATFQYINWSEWRSWGYHYREVLVPPGY